MTLVLPYEPPFDWELALGFYAHRTIEGIDEVSDGVYCRSIPGGNLEVWHEPGRLLARFSGRVPGDADWRLRSMFDLDANVAAVGAQLSREPFLAPLVAKRPAVRLPGWWDPFETAIKAVLGQQVSIVAARVLTRRLVDRCGSLPCFPTPEQVLTADLSNMGMPGSRALTLKAVAQASLDDPTLFARSTSVEETVARLKSIRGIGDWSAHYIAIRACREPDAFPASDVGLLRGAAENDIRPSPAELLARAEAWRPYRSYAAQHLWAEDAATPPKPRAARARM